MLPMPSSSSSSPSPSHDTSGGVVHKILSAVGEEAATTCEGVCTTTVALQVGGNVAGVCYALLFVFFAGIACICFIPPSLLIPGHPLPPISPPPSCLFPPIIIQRFINCIRSVLSPSCFAQLTSSRDVTRRQLPALPHVCVSPKACAQAPLRHSLRRRPAVAVITRARTAKINASHRSFQFAFT